MARCRSTASGSSASSRNRPATRAIINGGFFVLDPSVIDLIAGDETPWEGANRWRRSPRDGELMAYRHPGFWQPMDTLRDKNLLESHWATGRAPWKSWA